MFPGFRFKLLTKNGSRQKRRVIVKTTVQPLYYGQLPDYGILTGRNTGDTINPGQNIGCILQFLVGVQALSWAAF